MSDSTNNIEAVARGICSWQMAETGLRDEEFDAAVDRYWHCVAAELESGQIDEMGDRVTTFNLDNGLEAYRDWCRRHSQSTPR